MAWIKIGFFILVLAGPLAALGGLGPVVSYGQRPHPDYPTLHKIMDGQPGILDKMGEALLHRSIVTRTAIAIKNWIAYRIVGFVDTDAVVSGVDGWLFYKLQFWSSRCLDEKNTRKLLAQVDVMTDIAHAAGLKMIVSVSPDKSMIYPERLHLLGKKYWYCKAASGAMWRKLAKSEAPRILDHSEPILAAKIRQPDLDLYFHTDTHWTPYGAAFALRQLVATILQGDPDASPPPRLTTAEVELKPDMRNAMLLLPGAETYRKLDPAIEAELPRIGGQDGSRHIVVLRDSYYELVDLQLKELLEGAQTFHIDKHQNKYADAIGAADLLVVNSVERTFFQRAANGSLAWNSTLGRALLARNAQAAEHCVGFRAVAAAKDLHNVMNGSDGWAVIGSDPQIVVPVPATAEADRPCLRLKVDAPRLTALEIYLPRRVDKGPMFSEGRSIIQAVAVGQRTLAFILPAITQGLQIRIDPGAGPQAPIGISSIELGVLPPS